MTERPYVLCCPDKFRGALSAPRAAAALARGVRAAGVPARIHPLADGGEGTLDAVVAATGAPTTTHIVEGPLGAPVTARVALLDRGTAMIELAEAVGHAALAGNNPDVLGASTAGVGQLIGHALDDGATEIVVTLGGSVTVDGGLGALRSLGARLCDTSGSDLLGRGRDLERLSGIDLRSVHKRAEGRLTFAADVDTPLLGSDGAAPLFAPQKGASARVVERLEQGLEHLAAIVGADRGTPGFGAAGGFAVPFVSLLGARVVSGAELVQRLTRFDSSLEGALSCLTGEGAVDRGSVRAKTVAAVVRSAAASGLPVTVVGGAIARDCEALLGEGNVSVFPIGLRPRPRSEAVAQTATDLQWFGRSYGRLVVALQGAGADTSTHLAA